MASPTKEQAARDIKIVNGTEEGERLIGYLLDFCHVFKDSFRSEFPDALLFNEGQRSVGNEIVSLLYNEADRFKPGTVRKIVNQAEGTEI